MRIVGVVPLKLENERLPGKNLLMLPDGRPLMIRILEALAAVEAIGRTYVFCSDQSVETFATSAGAQFLQRDRALDKQTATSNDILSAFISQVDADVYVLAHATSPFLTSESIAVGLEAMKSGGYDSAFAALPLQEFLWQHGRPFNFNPSAIPRTQDIPPIHAETSGFYAFTRHVFLTSRRRVGDNPFVVEVSKIEAIDIDTAEDFAIAEAIMANELAATRPVDHGRGPNEDW